MPWARLDDTRHDHPKFLALGDGLYALAAVGLLDHAVTWASRHTKRGSAGHGVVPLTYWRTRGGRHWERLTTMLRDVRDPNDGPDGVGLIEEVPEGYRIHNFPAYGSRRDPEDARKAGQKGAQSRWGTDSNSHSDSHSSSHSDSHSSSHPTAIAKNGSRAGARAHPDPTRPDPVVVGSLNPPLPLTDADAKPQRGRDPVVAEPFRRARQRATSSPDPDLTGFDADSVRRVCRDAAARYDVEYDVAYDRALTLAALADTRSLGRLLEPAGWEIAGREHRRIAADAARRRAEDDTALRTAREHHATSEANAARAARIAHLLDADPDGWQAATAAATDQLRSEETAPLRPLVQARALALYDQETVPK